MAKGRQVASCWDGMYEVDERDQANVARIVECVNACEGVADPAVALEAARDALARALPFLEDCAELAGEFYKPGVIKARLKATRDALAALGG